MSESAKDPMLAFPFSEYDREVVAALERVVQDPALVPEDMAEYISEKVSAAYAQRLAVNAYAVYVLDDAGRMSRSLLQADTMEVVDDLVDAGIVAGRTCAPHQLCAEWYMFKLRVGRAIFNRRRPKPTHSPEFMSCLVSASAGNPRRS